MASVHGGVRPWWAQGSSVVYRVAPRRRSAGGARGPPPRRGARRAARWRPRRWRRPVLTSTQPTQGLGAVEPWTDAARSAAWSMWAASATAPSSRSILERVPVSVDGGAATRHSGRRSPRPGPRWPGVQPWPRPDRPTASQGLVRPKTADPATRTLAPAAATTGAVCSSMPPSTSRSTASSRSSIARRTFAPSWP